MAAPTFSSTTASKILTGARAQIMINSTVVGLFSNCSWSIRQQKVPAYILGRFSPGEIVSTSQEPVEMRLTGFRVVGAGPYAVAGAQHLKDLLHEADFSVQVMDRQTGQVIFSAQGCKVQGWNSGVQARGVSDLTVDIIGMIGEDESAEDSESGVKIDEGT